MINQVVKGAMTYLKRPYVLGFDENETKVYKLQIVRGNVIKEDAIVAYAAQAAAVPESTSSWQRMPCSTPSITSARMVAA